MPIEGFTAWLVNFEPLFWVHGIYSYALLLGGTVLLAVTLLRLTQVYRGQTVILLLAMAVPLAANLLAVMGLSPVPYLDLTSFAFVLSGLMLTVGLFRFRLFDLAPMARDAVIEDIPIHKLGAGVHAEDMRNIQCDCSYRLFHLDPGQFLLANEIKIQVQRML